MKISLRKAAALQNRINETIRSIKIVTTIGLNEFQKFDVVDRGNKDLLANDSRRKDLLVALYRIRGWVGAANAASGIDALLAQAAYTDKRIQQLSELTELQPRESTEVIEGRVAKLAGLAETSQRMRLYGEFDEVKVSLVSTREIKAFKQEVMELKKQKQSINDEILELNIKTEIELTAEVVGILQSEDLV